MTAFGDFKPLCTNTPSYTWCNLFYNQLQRLNNADSLLQGVSKDAASASVGVNPVCGIPRVGHEGSLGNIADLVACLLSMLVMGGIIFVTERRKAAVGRIEIRNFFICYFLTLPLQIITTGSFLEQGSTALVVLTAVHAGLVAALFWMLLANALIATQVLEDGTMSSLMPYFIFTVAFFVVTTYISLDVGLGFTSTLGPSSDPSTLHNIPLFIFTSIWPAVAALLYFVLMTYIVVGVLKETRPLVYYALAAFLFVLSQLAWFMLGKVICEGTSKRVDGSFIATILETASVVVLFFSWRTITVEDWDEDQAYYQNYKY
ncbi:hypothetical protein K435DRAFT_687056 [Dendrothele bispora CBS 962.96]|uniref:Uncharacterized protein n=1 Tax=Dendrothele bispora (strain CBS 962.96) TaxID=1314807 RepID=A0A4S8L7M1_DENBC|nr:hypothetical protein K435DRAFT_687056 [Dendrothele bispora CBS 962.96]